MAEKKATKKTINNPEKKKTAASVKKDDAYKFRSVNLKLSPTEVFGVAIESEIQATAAYSDLYEKVKNEILRLKLKFLIAEEKKHRRILERLFSQRFPGEKLEIPEKSFFPSVRIPKTKKISVLDLFKLALKAEKISEDF